MLISYAVAVGRDGIETLCEVLYHDIDLGSIVVMYRKVMNCSCEYHN